MYGYQKDPENHNHLIIDEYAARVVRRIYKLYLAGYGKQKIGSILTKEGILIPSLYKTEILGQKYHNANIISTTKFFTIPLVYKSVDLDELEEAVLLSVQMEARKILKGKDLDELKDITVHNDKSSLLEEEMKDVQKRMQKIQAFKKKTYNNYMEELITKDDYISYIAGYDSDFEELKEAQKSIEEKQLQQKDLDQQYDEWVEAFKDYINIKTLTREVVLELINKIEVNNDGSINIYYKFNNPYME